MSLSNIAAAKILNPEFGARPVPTLYRVTTPGTARQFTITMPAHIVANGGTIYVSAAGGGAGGGGGYSSGGGGGGGGGSAGSIMIAFPLFVVAGTTTLYAQVGNGGAGGAAGVAGTAGGDTWLRYESQSGEYLARLRGGIAGNPGLAANGGAGPGDVFNSLATGTGGATGNGGNGGSWVAVYMQNAHSMLPGGAGGGGAGNTGSTGGSGSVSPYGWGGGGAGAGAGGGGGSTLWSTPDSATNPPLFRSRVGSIQGDGGAGGGSPTAGYDNTAFYGGGGGGGVTQAGGDGNDGFLWIAL